jgi:replicative DNA helicase
MDKPNNKAILLAEMRLLNAIYLKPSFIIDRALNKELFQHDIAKSIFIAIHQLTQENIPITKNAVYERYTAIDENANLATLVSIIELENEPPEILDDIISDLQHAQRNVEAKNYLNEVAAKVGEKFTLSLEDKIDIREKLYAAEKLLLSDIEALPVQKIPEWIDTYIPEFDKRRNGKRFLFGDKQLDSLITEGPAPGTGGLIVASSGAGKSAFALRMVNGLLNADIPCMYFSLEMGGITTMDRLLSMRLQIPFQEIANPPDPQTFDSLRDIILKERLLLEQHKYLRFCENPSLYLTDVRNYIIKFQTEIQQNYCIVFFDLLSMLKDFTITKHGTNFANMIELAINDMNALAKELGFHYIGVVQLNRTIESDKIREIDDINKYRPTRTSIKNSNAYLERVRYCLSLFRKKYYAEMYCCNDDLQKAEVELLPDIVEIQLLKANNNKIAGYKMLFDPETFTMLPVIKEDDEVEGITD